MNRLVIIGASGHGKVISDIALEIGYKDIVFLDDDRNITECAGFPCVGGTAELAAARVYAHPMGEKASERPRCDYILAIGNASIRQRIQEATELQLANYEKASGIKETMVTLIHPSAVIGRDVEIGQGSVVMAGAVINHGAKLGVGCIVNTCASVDHDCVIGDYVHISVGSHVAGTTSVGDRTWVGVGATISNNINVCEDCMIGAGAVVVSDIKEQGTYIGVPAKRTV